MIIGGGFAGLAAGVALAGAGQRVRLLERNPHLGGRARSFLDPQTGSLVDNGQHLMMGCYHATKRFLKEIGTLDRIAFQPRLRIAFLELPGKLTTLECPDMPSPWHVLAGVMWSDGFSWREKVQILRLGRRLKKEKVEPGGAGQLTVEEWLTRCGQSEKGRREFWDLLAIAALNEDPQRAAASVFERVLRLALFTSPEDSCLGIPRVGLSECYTEAARDYIVARGGQVELGRGVERLIVRDGVVRGVQLADGDAVEVGCVISAVPWHEVVKLLPDKVLHNEKYFTNILSLRPAPIISINLWWERAITELEFAGLRGTTVQWLFNRDKLLGTSENHISLVLSGAHAHIDRDKDELLTLALHDLSEILPAACRAKLNRSLIIKERLATFSPCVGSDAHRPEPGGPIRGLYLAGDWTATGLPATIEGAVQSGYNAAEFVLQGA